MPKHQNCSVALLQCGSYTDVMSLLTVLAVTFYELLNKRSSNMPRGQASGCSCRDQPDPRVFLAPIIALCSLLRRITSLCASPRSTCSAGPAQEACVFFASALSPLPVCDSKSFCSVGPAQEEALASPCGSAALRAIPRSWTSTEVCFCEQ